MKLQVAAFLSFLIMPYALADDQGGLKKDVAPPPPHAIEDGYRGTDDAEKCGWPDTMGLVKAPWGQKVP